MRIAVLSCHTPSLFWFRMDMMQSFLKSGHTVYAVGNETEAKWSGKFAAQGIAYKQILVQRNGMNPLNDLRTLFSIKRVLQQIKPDKIFTFQAKTVIYGGLAANILGITDVYPMIAGLGSLFLKDNLKAKFVRGILTTEYRIALRKCPVIFFQNQDDRETFKEHGILRRQKVVMLHGSGVNTGRFEVQPLPERFGFLCISRLIRDKGVYEYLEACKRTKENYPQVRCLLVGPYDSNPSALKPEELRAYIEDGTIEYFGEQEDVRPYLGQCHVFILPSYREGTPKTVLEAMSSGRAVITTDAPGCRETVVDGENGYLVPIKDIDALCRRMEQFILDPALAGEMGRDGRRKAEKIFDVKLVNEKICEAMGV